MVDIKYLLINLRKRHRHSKIQMANKLGITKNFLYRVETGRRNFSEITLNRLFTEYNISEEMQEIYKRITKLNSASILIDLKNIDSLNKRELIVFLSENLDKISERTIKTINIILKKDLEKEGGND